jgi:hypothetical protein
MAGITYLCEANGGRIFKQGVGITQVGDVAPGYQLDLKTWDLLPAGEVGDVLFRTVNVAGRSTAGYAIGITPYVDGVAYPEQTFNSSKPGEYQLEAFVAIRGTRLVARVRTLSRVGEVEIDNVTTAIVPLRIVP